MQETIILIGLFVILTAAVSFLVKLLDQPIIIGYALTGLAASFILPGLGDQMMTINNLTVAVMLFIVGLEFDVRKLSLIGKEMILSTVAQSAIFFTAAYLLGIASGLPAEHSAYLGIFFMFSSTFLVGKWLFDRRAQTTLAGRLVLSSLLVQGALVIIARVIIHIISDFSIETLVLTPLYAVFMVGIAFSMVPVLKDLIRWSERYPELLFLVSLTTCILFVMAAIHLHLSVEIGAFIAGLVIASSADRSDMLTRFRPHLVVLGMVYFFSKGYQVDIFAGVGAMVLLVLVLCFAIKPVVAYNAFRRKGYDSRVSFVSAIYLAQISEVGFTLTITYGPAYMKPIALLSVMLGMVISSYLIKYDRELYGFAKKYLGRRRSGVAQQPLDYSVVFFGYQDVGRSIIESYQKKGKNILVVESDPANVETLKREGIPFLYDSVNNSMFFIRHGFGKVELVVSSLTDLDESTTIIKAVKSSNPGCIVVLTAKHLSDSLKLYSLGADYVIYTRYLREQHVSVLLEEFVTDASKIVEKKVFDIARLQAKSLNTSGSR